MIAQTNKSQGWRPGRRARLAGLMLAIGTGWAVAGLTSTPAAALNTSWKGACTFPAAPQGYGEMMRERVCFGQNYCQQMADAQGSPYTGNGCIMVAPSASAAQQQRRGSAFTRK